MIRLRGHIFRHIEAFSKEYWWSSRLRDNLSEVLLCNTGKYSREAQSELAAYAAASRNLAAVCILVPQLKSTKQNEHFQFQIDT